MRETPCELFNAGSRHKKVDTTIHNVSDMRCDFYDLNGRCDPVFIKLFSEQSNFLGKGN